MTCLCCATHRTATSLQLVQVPRSHCSPYALLGLPELPFRFWYFYFFFNAHGMAYKYICKYMYVNVHTHVNNSSLSPGPSLVRALHSPPLGNIHLLCMDFP